MSRKLTSLDAATSVSSPDLLYLVKSVGNAMYKLSIGTLFRNLANTGFTSNVSLTGQETVSAQGAINSLLPVTKLEVGGSGGNITLAAGSEGRLKTIILTSAGGGTYSLYHAPNAVTTFANVGDTATLMSLSNLWYYIGGTAPRSEL